MQYYQHYFTQFTASGKVFGPKEMKPALPFTTGLKIPNDSKSKQSPIDSLRFLVTRDLYRASSTERLHHQRHLEPCQRSR